MPPTSSRFRCSSRAIRRIEVDVQGVVVRLERPGGRPAGDRVQRRPFDLDETLAGQRVADRLHDLRPPQEPLQHAVGVDQIEVAHPLPQFGIGQALVLFGRRARCDLVRKCSFSAKMVSSPVLRALQFAVDADHVAQVEPLGQRPILLAHLVHADRHLDAAGPVAQFEEDQLAWPRCSTMRPAADLRAVLLGRLALARRPARRRFRLRGHGSRRWLMVVEAVAPGIDAQISYFVQLYATCGFQGGRAVLRFVGFVFAHGIALIGRWKTNQFSRPRLG